MRRDVAALLRLLLLAGGASFINPDAIDDHIDLNQVWVELPRGHVALGGDVHVRVHGASGGVGGAGGAGGAAGAGLRARLARDGDDGRALLATMPLTLDSERRMTLPCGYFSRGGIYYLELVADVKEPFLQDYDSVNSSDSFAKREVNIAEMDEDIASQPVLMETGDSVVKSWRFEVSWPSVRLAVTPELIQTYPERPVTAIVEFPGVECAPRESGADFWLELLFCGHSSGGAVLCDGRNTSSHAHVLYSEQMHGFPGRRTMALRCELFGQAGDYALTLRPAAAGPRDLAVTAFIKADWSEQFVLNVHGGSVLPCGGGARVLFQYPACSLEGADRVRVFGRDGSRMKYVAERRVQRGQHTASFDCRLFSERYPEYCFVYVSQAVTGAVADVRMDCLPTLPLSEGGAGGWGEWSPWSPCPSPDHCSTRTRSRHRFCDSPPPAYGAKYCEGQAVELAACECASRPWAGDAVGVVAEVGARCRCGCVLHLAPAARLLAGSARACAARSFWLLQAEEGLVVRLRFESVRLPCPGQALRARDGDSLASPLLASWDGPDGNAITGEATRLEGGAVELAGGRHILVELRSADTSDACAGGFLAHAMQMEPIRNASEAWASVSASSWWVEGGGARAAALALAGGAALAAVALALHSAHRTRAYQRAADKESLTDSDACSLSLELGAATAGSRSTLLSEVAGGAGGARGALRRLLPARRHTRLRDEGGGGDGQRDAEDDEATSELDNEDEDCASAASHNSGASLATVTPERVSASSAPAGQQATPSPLRRSHTISTASVVIEQVRSPPQSSIKSETQSTTADLSTSISSVSEREGDSCSEKDRDSLWEKERCQSRASSSTSAATLTNGWYSPALSGVAAARVRGNPKHSKESSNRRLLRSDLSLTSHPEMEIDYYDYEVNNAGSAPGSYLGMDPAFLVWIPPIEDGDIIREIDETQVPIYEEIVPKELHPDPGSNTESPEERPSSSTLKRNLDNRSEKSNGSVKSTRKVVDRTNIIHPLNFSITDLQHSTKLRRNKKKKDNDIPMKDLTLTRSPVKIHTKRDRIEVDNNATLKRVNDNARETRDDTLKRTSDLSDIKFADDSESSNDIKFADDDTPDSNKMLDKFDVRV